MKHNLPKGQPLTSDSLGGTPLGGNPLLAEQGVAKNSPSKTVTKQVAVEEK